MTWGHHGFSLCEGAKARLQPAVAQSVPSPQCRPNSVSRHVMHGMSRWLCRQSCCTFGAGTPPHACYSVHVPSTYMLCGHVKSACAARAPHLPALRGPLPGALNAWRESTPRGQAGGLALPWLAAFHTRATCQGHTTPQSVLAESEDSKGPIAHWRHVSTGLERAWLANSKKGVDCQPFFQVNPHVCCGLWLSKPC